MRCKNCYWYEEINEAYGGCNNDKVLTKKIHPDDKGFSLVLEVEGKLEASYLHVNKNFGCVNFLLKEDRDERI